MKKLLVLLLIAVLAAFVFTSCTVPSEGEGEGEGEVEAVTVEVDGEVAAAGKLWLAPGFHDIVVTFAAPVANVNVYVTECVGDYSKDKQLMYPYEQSVVVWPNATKTVWTGSGYFTCDPCMGDPCIPSSDCCASYVIVEAGECEGDTCIQVPYIVDCEDPYAHIELCMDDCDCVGCELSFTSTKTTDPCDPDVLNCGDDCSGLKAWSIALYDGYPFEDCCEIPCLEPIWSDSGTTCPIDTATTCLTEFEGEVVGYETICGELVCYDVTDQWSATNLPDGVTYNPPTPPVTENYTGEWENYCDEYLYCGDYVCGCCEWGSDTREVCTIDCVDYPIYACHEFFAILTLEDNVGNLVKYGTWVWTCDYPDCSTVGFDPIVCGDQLVTDGCLDDATGVFTTCVTPCECEINGILAE